MSDSEDDIIFENIPPNYEESATSTAKQLIPEKSKPRYDKVYSGFKSWLKSKHTNKINEKIVLTFFMEKSQVLNSSSLWTKYSMLKATMQLHDNIDISKFSKLIVFLKKRHCGYKPKKSKILQMEHIVRFLKEAPNKYYLMMKVATIMGISGACRTCELLAMRVDDIEDKGSVLIGKVFDTKRKLHRTFVVSNEEDLDLLKLYRDYVSLRPSGLQTRRLFVRYSEGKCVRQVVGQNILSKIPQRIAAFLELPDAVSYTGHCFRKTSITMLTKNHKSLILSRLHVGWRPAYVTQDESVSELRMQRNEVLPSPQFIKSEFVDGTESESFVTGVVDNDIELESLPSLKYELMGVLQDDVNGSSVPSSPASYEDLLKENLTLKQEVCRLNLLVQNMQQQLLLSKQREERLEQMVRTVKEIVNQDVGTVLVHSIKEEN